MSKRMLCVEATLHAHPELRALLDRLRSGGIKEAVELPEVPLKVLAEMQEALEFEVDLETDADLDEATPAPTVPPAPLGAKGVKTMPSSGSVPITIRIPVATLGAIQAQARSRCVPYQTLINRILRAASAGWPV